VALSLAHNEMINNSWTYLTDKIISQN